MMFGRLSLPLIVGMKDTVINKYYQKIGLTLEVSPFSF